MGTTVTTTIAGLRVLTSPLAADIYYTTDIGQEGDWRYDPSDTASIDNLGTILVSTLGHRFKRIYDGYVNVKWFGAVGNRFHDDTPDIQKALDFISTTDVNLIFPVPSPGDPIKQDNRFGGGTLFFPEGCYLITNTLKVGAHCRLLGITRGGAFNPTGRFNTGFPYNNSYPYFTGSVILHNFQESKDMWAIETATYFSGNDPATPMRTGLTKEEVSNSVDIDSPMKVNQSSGLVIENLIIDGCRDYWPGFYEGFPNYPDLECLYGGIKISSSLNAVIRNVTIVNVKIGIMLSGSWNSTIENVTVSSRYYGAIIVNNNFTQVTNCYFGGSRLIDKGDSLTNPGWLHHYNCLIDDDFFANTNSRAFYNQVNLDDPINDFGFDMTTRGYVKKAKTAVWIAHSSNVSFSNIIGEYYTNGIVALVSSVLINGGYLEGNRYASVVVGGQTYPQLPSIPSYPSSLTINQLSLATTGKTPDYQAQIGVDPPVYVTIQELGIDPNQYGFGFLFGNHVLASLDGVGQFSGYPYSPLFEINDAINRNISFQKTIQKSRIYKKDIQFIDEGVNGQNFGSVYIDPINGSDTNYGFNENDPLATFDEALVRVQNQSTLNPVKKIQLKRGTTTSKLPVPMEIENADILVCTYGVGLGRAALLYEAGGVTNNTGYILLGSNVKLTFKGVNIDVSNSTVTPTAVGFDVSFFCLKDNFGQIHFEDLSINLRTDYVLLSNYTTTGVVSFGLFETKMVKVKIDDNLTAAVGTALLCNSTNPMTIDCKQISSSITPVMASKPNRGWDVGNVIYNNL